MVVWIDDAVPVHSHRGSTVMGFITYRSWEYWWGSKPEAHLKGARKVLLGVLGEAGKSVWKLVTTTETDKVD